MRFDNDFTVPAPPDQVWQALADPQLVAGCLGAVLESSDDGRYAGRLRTRLGRRQITWLGTLGVVDRSPGERRAVLRGEGSELRGDGALAATVDVGLSDADGGTAVRVGTDLEVTGGPAEIDEASFTRTVDRLVTQLGTALTERLAPPSALPAPDVTAPRLTATPTATAPLPTPETLPTPEPQPTQLRPLPPPPAPPRPRSSHRGAARPATVGAVGSVAAVVALLVMRALRRRRARRTATRRLRAVRR